MRVTNQMVNHSALKNMQRSQSRVSITTTRMTTGKKIQKASDDPVVAMRALKLRSTVTQLAQYKDKNIKDANSWMDVTETSLVNIIKRLTDVYNYCVQGANDTFDSTAKSSVADALDSLKDMIYAEGSATYAGRYIFSGFRTGTDLAFSTKEAVEGVSYDITEHLTNQQFKKKNIVTNEMDFDKVDEYTANIGTAYTPPRDGQVTVLKLAYNDLEKDDFKITFDGKELTELGCSLVTKDGSQPELYYQVGDKEVAYIPETGELVFGKEALDTLQPTKDIKVEYSKDSFKVGDLRPDHYFDCVKHEPQSDGSIRDIQFTQPEGGQELRFEVNFNQFLTVNTQGREAITHDMGNAIDEISNALRDWINIEDTITRMKALKEDAEYQKNPAKMAALDQLLEDADIEMALKRDYATKLFEQGETIFTNFTNKLSALQSDVGTRMNKLDMIATRVKEQYVNFDELKSSNEDVETEEAIIDFNEANVVYNASLAATSNILQTTLLDYL